jgi:hypothetical protein
MVPEGHVRVIFRNGVYRRAVGPGKLPIFIPLLESWGPLIKVSAQVHEFTFREIYSQDKVPLYITLSVEYSFDPRRLSRDDAATEIARQEEGRQRLIYAQFERALRNVIEYFKAGELEKNPSIEGMEGHIYGRSHRYLRHKGIYIESPHSIHMSEVSRVPPGPEVERVNPQAAPPPAPNLEEGLVTPVKVDKPDQSDLARRFIAKSPAYNRPPAAKKNRPGEGAAPPEPPEAPEPHEFQRPDVLSSHRRRRDMPSNNSGKEQ